MQPPPFGPYNQPPPPMAPERPSKVPQIASALFGVFVLIGGASRLYRTFVPPAVGESCTGNSARCLDARTWLYCVNDRLAARSCHGPAGCGSNGSDVTCDEAVSTEGASCTGAVGACSEDGQTLLRCDRNTLRVAARCPGPRHCTATRTAQAAAQVVCDGAVAELGYVCVGEVGACSADHRALLRCQGGHIAPYAPCRGPGGCVEDPVTHDISCDGTIRALGDPCHVEGAHGCSADGTQFLQCTGGTIAAQASCGAGERCQIRGDRIGCMGDAPAEGAGVLHVPNTPVRRHH